MNFKTVASLTIGLLTIYGMTVAQPSPAATTIAQANAEPPYDSRSDRSPWQLIKAKAEKGMAYSELRQFALSNGWEALVDPNCKTNVGGAATICKTQPETSACSGQGHCIFQFQHRFKDVAVKIITYNGRIRSADFKRKRSETQTTQSISSSCPSQDFTRFLAAFSSNKTIQDQFTLPEIRVETLVDDEQGFRTKTIVIPKAQYSEYTLVYRNGTFYNNLGNSNIPLTLSPDPKPKSGRLNIIKQGENYFVKSLIGVSEGNSWLFKRTAGCWSLAEDPEAPSP